MGRTTTAAAVAVVLLFLGGCGSAERSPTSSGTDLEPATVRGLAAAVLTHLDPERVGSTTGNSNDDEHWMGVQTEVEVADAVVPLSVMVSGYADDGARPSASQVCEADPAALSCRTRPLDDGSFVVFLTSTEDLTGGILETGLVAYVAHYRDDSAVMAMEDVPSRKRHHVDMTRLPVDVQVLEAIVTDPMVGRHTSPELNDAGEDLDGRFPDS